MAQRCQIRKSNVISLRFQAISKTGAVHEQIQAVFLTHPRKGGKFRKCVDRAQFRRIGNIHQFRLHHMLVRAGIPLLQHNRFHLCRGQLAVLGGNCQHLMSGRLHCAGFMDMDMPRICADDALMGPQGSIDHRYIGLGAAHQKVHRKLRIPAQSANFFRSRLAIFIAAVTAGLFQICLGQASQNRLMTALAVIIVKINHRIPRFYTYAIILSPELTCVKNAYLAFRSHSFSLVAHSIGGEKYVRYHRGTRVRIGCVHD